MDYEDDEDDEDDEEPWTWMDCKQCVCVCYLNIFVDFDYVKRRERRHLVNVVDWFGSVLDGKLRAIAHDRYSKAPLADLKRMCLRICGSQACAATRGRHVFYRDDASG